LISGKRTWAATMMPINRAAARSDSYGLAERLRSVLQQ
jgi:hypothetical protein